LERGTSRIVTLAPLSTSMRVVASPRPDAPPVTIAPMPWTFTASVYAGRRPAVGRPFDQAQMVVYARRSEPLLDGRMIDGR